MRKPYGCGHSVILIFFSMLMLTLVACEGSRGQRGAEGPPGPAGDTGPPGTVTAGPVPQELTVSIADVAIDSTPVVEFVVLDQDGFAFNHLQQASFTIAKLVPGVEGRSSAWQSYINRRESAGSGAWPGTEPAIQATAENSAEGTLMNLGEGRYRYRFATDLSAVEEPLEVDFEPSLTHRVGMQIGGTFRGEQLPAANAVYSFQPSTGLTAEQGITQRRVVAQASCNACHGNDLALHGGNRVDVQYCVTCHNPGSEDAQSGHSLDFAVMLHKIHSGETLPSVLEGDEYIIWGYRDRPHDYSDVVFPQDVRHCTTCHDPADPATPEAIQITSKPTIETCGSCHDDIRFIEGVGHSATDNTECLMCHSEQGVDGDILARHQLPAQEAARRFQFNILEILNTGQGEVPEVTFSVTDPTAEEAPYNVLADEAFGMGAGLSFRIGWNTDDYQHGPAAGISITDITQTATDNGDGTFSVSATEAIAADVTGSGTVGMEGRAVDPDNGTRIPITGTVAYFPITDASPTPRRQVVASQKCQVCHGENDGLAFHGGQRTDEVQLCAICHNPNTTDLGRRAGDTVIEGISTLDGLAERSVNLSYMVHAIHGSAVRDEPYVVYGFGNTAHDFSHVRYPRSAGDCQACHLADSFQLPLPEHVLGVSVDTQGSPENPWAHLKISPTAAACSSCHSSDLAQSHMSQNGAVFGATQDVLDGAVFETCAVCHGPGQIADVERVHE